jgi:hypothetical protein
VPGILVDIGVEQPVGVTIADQEAAQARGVRGMRRTSEDDTALPALDQAHATQNEGAHDDLADVRLARNQLAETGRVHAHETGFHARASVDHDLAFAEEVDLTGELVGAMNHDGPRRAVLGGIVDLDRALDHEEIVDTAFATPEQHGAGGHDLFVTVFHQPRGHLLTQVGKGLLTAIHRARRIVFGRYSHRAVPGDDGRDSPRLPR